MADEIIARMNDGIESLKKLVAELNADYNHVNFNYILHEGDTPESIIQKGIEEKPDLIVMGTLGASGIKRAFFGSNTVTVIKHSVVPVLVVPSGVKIFVPNNIVFATDYLYTEMDALLALVDFASAMNSSISVVHIIKNVEEESDELQLIENFKEQVLKFSRYQKMSFTIFRNIDILEGLKDFTEATGADLLALTTRKRGAFEKLFNISISEQLAYQYSVPMIVFHENERFTNPNF
jgi:nucleotide-binding universal stress UspA family protein